MYSDKLLNDISVVSDYYLNHHRSSAYLDIFKINEFDRIFDLDDIFFKVKYFSSVFNQINDDNDIKNIIKNNESLIKLMNISNDISDDLEWLKSIEHIEDVDVISNFFEEYKLSSRTRRGYHYIIAMVVANEDCEREFGLGSLDMTYYMCKKAGYISWDSDGEFSDDAIKKDKERLIRYIKFINEHSLESLKSEDVVDIEDNYRNIKSVHGKEIAYNAVKYYKLIKELDCNVNSKINPEDMIERLKLYNEMLTYIKDRYAAKSILYVLEGENFSNKELSTYLYKIKENNENVDLYTFGLLESKQYYGNIEILIKKEELCLKILNFIYPNLSKYKKIQKQCIEGYPSVVKRLLRSKKKNVLQIIDNLPSNNCKSILDLLNHKHICEYLVLGDISEKDINQILKRFSKDNVYSLSNYISNCVSHVYEKTNIKVPAREVVFFANASSSRIRVYVELLDIKLDERIKLVNELPLDIGRHDEKKVANLIREKSFNNRIKELCSNKTISKKDLSKNKWLSLVMFEKIDDYKDQIENLGDVNFLINHIPSLSKMDYIANIKEERINVILNSNEFQAFIRKLGVEEEFVNKYAENIMKFVNSGLANKFMKYDYSLNNPNVVRNLKRITKAHIMGRLDDVKFGNNDLSKEIEYEVDEVTESKWRKNIKINNGNFTIQEKYDYSTVINLGAIPVRTCMHYEDGCYNQCLMSNFDANKKIITIEDDNKTVARAVLRITKISNKKNVSNEGLSFVDLEEDEFKNAKKFSCKEELVLFLERCYTFRNEAAKMRDMLMDLAIEKAKDMNIRIVVANGYSKKEGVYYDSLGSKKYMCITKSKNGVQYADSFGGYKTNYETQYANIENMEIIDPSKELVEAVQ